MKVFDNAYYLGMTEYAVWAITTSLLALWLVIDGQVQKIRRSCASPATVCTTYAA